MEKIIGREYKGKKLADNAVKQGRQHDWLKDYQWKPGQSGNPKGRPKGKTLKEWAKDFLMELPDDKKLEFLKELAPEIVWKMAEGQPHITTDITTAGKPMPLLNVLHNPSDKENSEAPEKD